MGPQTSATLFQKKFHLEVVKFAFATTTVEFEVQRQKKNFVPVVPHQEKIKVLLRLNV